MLHSSNSTVILSFNDLSLHTCTTSAPRSFVINVPCCMNKSPIHTRNIQDLLTHGHCNADDFNFNSLHVFPHEQSWHYLPCPTTFSILLLRLVQLKITAIRRSESSHQPKIGQYLYDPLAIKVPMTLQREHSFITFVQRLKICYYMHRNIIWLSCSCGLCLQTAMPFQYVHSRIVFTLVSGW